MTLLQGAAAVTKQSKADIEIHILFAGEKENTIMWLCKSVMWPHVVMCNLTDVESSWGSWLVVLERRLILSLERKKGTVAWYLKMVYRERLGTFPCASNSCMVPLTEGLVCAKVTCLQLAFSFKINCYFRPKERFAYLKAPLLFTAVLLGLIKSSWSAYPAETVFIKNHLFVLMFGTSSTLCFLNSEK